MHMVSTQGGEAGRSGVGGKPRYGRDAICVARTGERFVSGWLMVLWTVALAVMLIAGTARAADYVIVVDVSGSMTDAIGKKDKRVRVAVVQEELQRFLPALPTGSRVNLLAFNKGIVSEKEIRLAEPKDYADALAWANELPSHVHANAPTYLWTTLRHALTTATRYSLENPDQPVAVRVLTDGEDNERFTGLSLDKVLQEFLPVLDGEKIRSNLVLLGDLEFKTKLKLPEGAFEMTRNTAWEVIFPPIVLWTPAEPKIGEEVRLFENNTRSIYKDYQWQVDGVTVSQEKVLAWSFKEPRMYRVTLQVTGLQGTQNSATVLVRAIEPEKIPAPQAAFRILTQQPKVGSPIQLVDETKGPVESVTWEVDGVSMGTTRNPEFVLGTAGEKTVRLTVHGPGGESVATRKLVVQPQYVQPVVWCGASKFSGTAPLTVQFTNRITGDYKSLVWTFGDGQTSTNSNPTHTYNAATNYTASLIVTPMDATQPEARKQLTIKVVKPWPAWAKATAVGVPCLLLLGGAAGVVCRRRRKALRLPVYYFAEQSPVCSTAVLTESGQTLQLTPSASIRLRREGKSRNLVAEPLAGAALLNTDGQEMTAIPVGDGVLVTVRDAAGQTRAVAISTRQKPRRPTAAISEQASLSEAAVCGIHSSSGDEPSPSEPNDFDWGWDKASTKVG